MCGKKMFKKWEAEWFGLFFFYFSAEYRIDQISETQGNELLIWSNDYPLVINKKKKGIYWSLLHSKITKRINRPQVDYLGLGLTSYLNVFLFWWICLPVKDRNKN